MVSFSSHVLSIFAQNLRFGTDVNSCSRRYRILSMIYFNIVVFFILLFNDTFLWNFLGITNFTYTAIAGTFAPIGLWLIRKGKDEEASLVLMIEMHVLDFCAGYITDKPVPALIALMVLPNTIFLLSTSVKFWVLNIFLVSCQYVYHSSCILSKFKVTFDEEQNIQILTGVLTSFCSLTVLCTQCLIQKSVEASLREVAQTNYQKSEDLTREAIQAVESKDMFISSLSHEIRNPLNSMTGSIDYLLSVAKDSGTLKVLRNAKLSSEILLNLINNLLDAAKLKSDKMDVAAVETNFEEIIQKVFTINSESLLAKDICAQAFIDRRLPALLWVDPSRMIQILMNLLSNALKFTKPRGKIHIYVTWCSSGQKREQLLNPTENFTANENNKSLSSSHRLPSQFNLLSSESRDPETLAFEEFNKRETRDKLKNFQAIKHFKVNNLNISTISTSPERDHNDSEFEPWIIRRTRMLSGNPRSSRSLAFGHEPSPNDRTGYLKVEVLDTGCGIAEADLPKLFVMFNQVHRNLTSSHGGTGLGLWICKQICEKLGGDITVYSQINQGTRFVFYVPINNQSLTSGGGLSLLRNSPQKGVVRALVVDDFAFNRDLHKLLLQQEGVNVTLARDGKEAFEKYKAGGSDFFDFILMDVQMPVMDGFTSAKEIRSWEMTYGRRNVDIYFVSGEYFNEDDVLAGFKTQEKGAEPVGLRYLRKPVDVKMLKNIVLKFKDQVKGSCASTSAYSIFRSSSRQTIYEVENMEASHAR